MASCADSASTSIALHQTGYEVFVVTDASGTFNPITRDAAWNRMSASCNTLNAQSRLTRSGRVPTSAGLIRGVSNSVVTNVLDRQFDVAAPNIARVTDISTYVPMRIGCIWPLYWIYLP